MFEEGNQEMLEYNESDVEDYAWHSLFGILILQNLLKDV